MFKFFLSIPILVFVFLQPSAKAGQSNAASKCGREVIVQDDDRDNGSGVIRLSGYELINENPVTIRGRNGQTYTRTYSKGTVGYGKVAGQTDWFNGDGSGSGTTTDIKKEIGYIKERANNSPPCITTADFNCDAINQNTEKKLNGWNVSRMVRVSPASTPPNLKYKKT
ncbi:hypothetical protein ACQE3D_04490 [Methylomonas sp. MS20]|uniref:hypothetical protein n=1 Tax=unclassified Methylomonas TaxID=2608980 RepID=UPI0028A3C516|nr:hypothetical protein [Methylomonas sp. MV1]MDT4329864.1 hypothetical protein [Methylomonas sp. MV1]